MRLRRPRWQDTPLPFRLDSTVRCAIQRLPHNGPCEHAQDFPDRRLGDRQTGSARQNRTHYREAFKPIVIDLKLPPTGLARDGKDRRQPVISRDETRHEIAADQENFALALGKFNNGLNVPDESFERGRDRISFPSPQFGIRFCHTLTDRIILARPGSCTNHAMKLSENRWVNRKQIQMIDWRRPGDAAKLVGRSGKP